MVGYFIVLAVMLDRVVSCWHWDCSEIVHCLL